METNFHGQTNVKYFMQTQVLWFCKDTAKVSSLPLLKITTKSIHFPLRRRRYQYCGLNFKQIKYKRSQNLTSKHRAVKNLQIFFQKMWIKKLKISYFLLHSSFLSIYLHKSMHKKWTFPLRISLVNVNISA